MKNRMIFCAVSLLAIMAGGATNALAQDNDDYPNTTTATTVTNATGTITQLNYGEDGTIEGFLLGTNILLSFPTNICGGIGTLGVAGNAVTYSGTARTNSTTGFQTVRVTSFTNGTITYTSTTSTPTSTAYGPTSGTVKLLNYSSGGAVDGFLFTSGSTTVLVVTGSGASATLKPLLTVGGIVSVTGTTSTKPTSACVATGTPTGVVKASSLIINGQTVIISRSGGGKGDDH